MGLALMLCDTIIEDRFTGKKSLIGLFSQIHAQKIPCIHQSMMLLVSMTSGQGTYSCEIVFEHADLPKPVFRTECPLTFENPFQVVDLVYQLKIVRFPLPGKYWIKVNIDGVSVMMRPLMVLPKKQEDKKPKEEEGK